MASVTRWFEYLLWPRAGQKARTEHFCLAHAWSRVLSLLWAECVWALHNVEIERWTSGQCQRKHGRWRQYHWLLVSTLIWRIMNRNNFRPGALGVWQRNARVVNTNMNSPVASMRSAQYGMLLQLSSYQGFRHQTWNWYSRFWKQYVTQAWNSSDLEYQVH